ncbi:hypothetical protein B296_00038647 [Ensete ventricosum]|uniref:Uncharacterized protein n=1 Tax=Ensete ventricosum TaxID=4639 RepID=A0A426XMS4_ENSVE|nr:hypothetical protein B296_00038647 [Ensete ventricosum]
MAGPSTFVGMAVETWRYHKAGKAKGKFRCVEKSVWRPTQRTVGTTGTAGGPGPSLCLGGRAKKVTPSPFSRSPSLEISKEGRRRDVAAKGVLVEGLVIFPWPLQGFQKLGAAGAGRGGGGGRGDRWGR